MEKTINKLMNYYQERMQNVSLHPWMQHSDNGKRRFCHFWKQSKGVRKFESGVKWKVSTKALKISGALIGKKFDMYHGRVFQCCYVWIFCNTYAGFTTMVKQWVTRNKVQLYKSRNEDSCLYLRWKFKLLSKSSLVQMGLIQQNVLFLSCS